jgi:uncharacterized C2H2 Zn-finger protein
MLCAYCTLVVQIDVGQQVRIVRRSDEIAKVRCPACDSTFVVELSTRRVTKGKGAKKAEVQLAAKQTAEVAAARELNARIGEQLIAMPACTCTVQHGHRYSDLKDDKAGHLLSTGYSRSASGAMVPTLPRHFHRCPCHGTEAEAAILSGARS